MRSLHSPLLPRSRLLESTSHTFLAGCTQLLSQGGEGFRPQRPTICLWELPGWALPTGSLASSVARLSLRAWASAPQRWLFIGASGPLGCITPRGAVSGTKIRKMLYFRAALRRGRDSSSDLEAGWEPRARVWPRFSQVKVQLSSSVPSHRL